MRLWPSETCPMPDSRGLWAVPVGRVDHTHHPHAGVGPRGCRRKPEESIPRGPREGGAPLPTLLGRTALRRSAPCAPQAQTFVHSAQGCLGGTSGWCDLQAALQVSPSWVCTGVVPCSPARAGWPPYSPQTLRVWVTALVPGTGPDMKHLMTE